MEPSMEAMPNEALALAKELAKEERRLFALEDEYRQRYPEASHYFDELADAHIKLEERRKELKEVLHNANDYDLHQEEDGLEFSITKVVRMKVKDIDEVEPEFKQMMEVADEKRAANYYKLYGEAPKGFVDNSYDRLNWTVRLDAPEE